MNKCACTLSHRLGSHSFMHSFCTVKLFNTNALWNKELPSFLQLLRRELLEVAGNRSDGLALLACCAGAMFRDCIAEACLS